MVISMVLHGISSMSLKKCKKIKLLKSLLKLNNSLKPDKKWFEPGRPGRSTVLAINVLISKINFPFLL